MFVYLTTISKDEAIAGRGEGGIPSGPGPVPLCASLDFWLWEPQNWDFEVDVAGVSFQRRQILSFKVGTVRGSEQQQKKRGQYLAFLGSLSTLHRVKHLWVQRPTHLPRPE